MLEYDKINIDEGIYVDKNELISKECIICRYWYFINKILIIKDMYVMVVTICLQELLVCII